jgi:hypothetical protein
MSDGLGVARLKDSAKELEKAEASSTKRGNGSKEKENKRVPSTRSLTADDIEDADLYSASWACASGECAQGISRICCRIGDG